MAVAADRWQWTVDSFLRAEESGLFGRQRVQLVGGEVSVLVQGIWHGRVCGNLDLALGTALRDSDWRITHETLLLATDAPDPDRWVVRRRAAPRERIGRLGRYNPADIALVVEVSDSSEVDDLATMARVYGSNAVPEYWAVTRAGLYVHRQPVATGYGDRSLVTDRVAVPHSETTIAIDELLATE